VLLVVAKGPKKDLGVAAYGCNDNSTIVSTREREEEIRESTH
jgi:hypothetical protein